MDMKKIHLVNFDNLPSFDNITSSLKFDLELLCGNHLKKGNFTNDINKVTCQKCLHLYPHLKNKITLSSDICEE